MNDFDITKFTVPGSGNYLAIEIFPPDETDLTISWVDWNPTPPDFGMGIWYDVALRATGRVDITNPQVITDLDLPALDKANLTVFDESKKILKIEIPRDMSDVYFLKLHLSDSAGEEVSTNFYWLSVKGDEDANFKALNNLFDVQLTCSVKSLTEKKGKFRLSLTTMIFRESPWC